MLIRILIAIIVSACTFIPALSSAVEPRKTMTTIIMYSTATCPFCERARQLLQQKKLSFKEIRVDEHPEKRAEMTTKSQRSTVPQIFINQHHVGGCDDLYAMDADGRLDKLLNKDNQ